MFIYSRTSSIKDLEKLNIDSMLKTYARLPKPDFQGTSPRYKFWDYAITFKVAKELGAARILDIGFGNDLSYKILCNYNNIELYQVHINDFFQFPIRYNKFPLVTSFGVLEHIGNVEKYLKKIFRHVFVDGALVITTDSESTRKNRKRIITSEDLIGISFMAEEAGFEFYPENNFNPFEYTETKSIELMSLVLKRIGK